MRIVRYLAIAFAAILFAGGCVVYEPVPVSYGAATYDRAWSAALGALGDAGVQVTSADAGSGVIRGRKGGLDVSVSVLRQPDGRTRVQFDSKGDASSDPGLAGRFDAAYERRMGR